MIRFGRAIGGAPSQAWSVATVLQDWRLIEDESSGAAAGQKDDMHNQ